MHTCSRFSSLRWHYPDQVRGVEGIEGPPLSLALQAPLDTSFLFQSYYILDHPLCKAVGAAASPQWARRGSCSRTCHQVPYCPDGSRCLWREHSPGGPCLRPAVVAQTGGCDCELWPFELPGRFSVAAAHEESTSLIALGYALPLHDGEALSTTGPMQPCLQHARSYVADGRI